MAVDAHLRTAADAMMRAAGELKTEIDQLRSDDANLKKLIATQIAQLNTQVQLHQSQSSKIDTSNTIDNLQTSIKRLNEQLASKQQELNERGRVVEEAIKAKQAQINDLEAKARSLMG